MAPSTDDVALSDVVNGIASFRRAWSSAIAIAKRKRRKFSYHLPLAPRQVPVPLTYYVRVRRQNAATHRMLVRVISLVVRLKEDFFGFFAWCILWESVTECEEVGVEITFFFFSFLVFSSL